MQKSLGYDVSVACRTVNAAVCMWERGSGELIAVDTCSKLSLQGKGRDWWLFEALFLIALGSPSRTLTETSAQRS